MFFLSVFLLTILCFTQQQYCTNFQPASQKLLQNIIPRNSAFVNKCKKHFNYQQYADKIYSQLQISDQYKFIKPIGEGGSGDVYIGQYKNKKKKVILKKLKRMKSSDTEYNLRSLYYQQILSECPNIDKPLDIFRNNVDQKITFAYQYFKTKKFKLNKIILYKILSVLDYSHKNGVIHRDIKPDNIVIHKNQDIRVIDWNLATLYFFSKENQLQLGTISYFSPEMLLKYPFYHYSIDLWGLGASMIQFYYGNILQGFSEIQMFKKYLLFFGTKVIQQYIQKYNIKLNRQMDKLFLSQYYEPTKIYQLKQLRQLSQKGIDLMMKMLTFDHNKRILAQQALNHEFFSDIQYQIRLKKRIQEAIKQIKQQQKIKRKKKQAKKQAKSKKENKIQIKKQKSKKYKQSIEGRTQNQSQSEQIEIKN